LNPGIKEARGRVNEGEDRFSGRVPESHFNFPSKAQKYKDEVRDSKKGEEI